MFQVEWICYLRLSDFLWNKVRQNNILLFNSSLNYVIMKFPSYFLLNFSLKSILIDIRIAAPATFLVQYPSYCLRGYEEIFLDNWNNCELVLPWWELPDQRPLKEGLFLVIIGDTYDCWSLLVHFFGWLINFLHIIIITIISNTIPFSLENKKNIDSVLYIIKFHLKNKLLYTLFTRLIFPNYINFSFCNNLNLYF